MTVSETTTREETKREKPAKRGLHGWKAALAVFGCGTLAAFAVFGVIVGLLSTLVSTVSSGVQGSSSTPPPIAMTGAPQESIEPGDLDLCSRNLPAAAQVSLLPAEGGEDNYEDRVVDGERRVSDSCVWELRSEYDATESWSLDYSYDAVISSEGSDRIDVASSDYDRAVESLDSDFFGVENQGDSRFADRSYFVHGDISPGVTGYVLLLQTRSAVYKIKIEGAGEIPELPMEKEAEKLVRVSEIEFGIWIPGADE
ncbi:hypothetical protein [Nocardiopsis alba]|uniref:hypothetical protein n=1 Tax=Nocardiopsis alba TaxID=53437 RepID=UPI00363E3606